MKLLLGAVVVGAVALPGCRVVAGEAGYHRWPDLRGGVLVFASEGDLWRAAADGGPATRLTSHPEGESHPAISPDGQWIAFGAGYDGAPEIYVMPISGGVPRQLTFEGGGTTARGWTPSGQVLFTSQNALAPQERLLRTVDPHSGAVETLPLSNANQGVVTADGQTLFFTRFGLAARGDNAVLYRGGSMSQLWKADLRSAREASRLAEDFGAPIVDPMWWDGRVYFISDKSGSDNIWSVDEAGADARRHTRFQGWQLRHARLHDGAVVYQRGADLFRYDLRRDAEAKLDLTLVSDRDQSRMRWIAKPYDHLEHMAVSSDGKVAALTARGRVAIAGVGERRRVVIDIPEEARARAAVPGGKGDWIYVILDQGRRGEIWRYPADGRGPPKQLTTGSDARIWRLHPSPDGGTVLFDDKSARLWSVDVETGTKTLVDHHDGNWDDAFGGFAWSTDGRYVAYSKGNRRGIAQVVLRDLGSGRSAVVSGSKYGAFAPAFSPDGAWLYFISERNFMASPSAPWGDRNMGPAFDRRAMLFAVQLRPGTQFPFAKPDELAAAPRKEVAGAPDRNAGAQEDGDPEAKSAPAIPEVVFDGLAQRLWQLPVKPGNYEALAASDKLLFVLDGEDATKSLKTIAIDPEDPAIKVFWPDTRRFALSADRKTVLVRAQADGEVTLALVAADAKAPRDLAASRIRTTGWRLGIDARAEWRQMLTDAWRLHRDYAFDHGLRGVDWDAVLEKYLPLVDRLGNRSELDDVMSQMSAELGILHSQVRDGDHPRDVEGGVPSFLGAVTSPVQDGLELSLIHDAEPDLPLWQSPLRQPGVDVRAGDVLTAVDGRPVRQPADLWAALLDKTGRQVRLDLRRGGDPVSAIVRPVAKREADTLRYRHWVERNRQRVATDSSGQVGYLALRAMGRRDIESFARDFYEHFDKDALVIDVRGNSGGNVDSWIIATLLRRVWAFWARPVGGLPYGNMQQTFRGHLAVLVDQGTYSDGETLAAGVKALCLGTLVGERTAGAGIWLSDRNRLADGGIARIAQTAQYRLDGGWMLEGQGVTPDIVITNPPRATFAGADAQLDAAIRHLLARIEERPVPKLEALPIPALGATGLDVEQGTVPSPSCR